MDTVIWAEWDGQQTGQTSHLMDAGVDTCPILNVRPSARVPGESIDAFCERLEVLSVSNLIDGVLTIRNGHITPPQRVEAGRQYFVLHRRLRREMVRILQCRGQAVPRESMAPDGRHVLAPLEYSTHAAFRRAPGFRSASSSPLPEP